MAEARRCSRAERFSLEDKDEDEDEDEDAGEEESDGRFNDDGGGFAPGGARALGWLSSRAAAASEAIRGWLVSCSRERAWSEGRERMDEAGGGRAR